MASVVLTHIMKDRSGNASSMILKGTVDAVAHYYRHTGPFAPFGPVFSTPTALATAFKLDFDQFAAINTALNAVSVDIGKNNLAWVTVLFGAGAAAKVGPDQVEVTATVGGVSTVMYLSKAEFYAATVPGASGDGYVRLAKMFVEQADRNGIYNATNRDYIATFTIT